MADNVLKSYLISLGFKEVGGAEFKRSVKDYEKAVVQAEKAIEDARWAGAKTQDEIAKLTRETNLRLAREALAKAKEVEKAEAEVAKKRKADAEAVAAVLGKVALAAAAAATAIGYAVEKITKSFDNLYFQAQRSGTSVESLKAIGHAFSQTGGSAQAAQASVDSFTTKIRNNPGLRQFTKELGVDQKLGGVDQYLATLDAIKAKTAGSPGVGAQYAEMLGISEENYNQFLRQGEAIKAYKKEYDDLAAKLRFNADEAAEGATAFQRSLGRLSATAGLVVDKLLTALAPALKAIVDRFQAWIESNPGALEKILDNISKAAIAVAEAIGRFLTQITGGDGDEAVKMWDAFAERAERFAKTIERIVYGVEKLLKLIGFISDKEVVGAGTAATRLLNNLSGGTLFPNEPGGSNTGNAVPPDERTWKEKLLPKSMGGADAPQAGDGSRAWRNNNPGNIKYGRLAQSLGATGADSGGFAKFPSYEAGRKAQEKLLFESAGYKDKTIKEAIQKWAPSFDGNDPDGYAGTIAKAAGVPVDTPLASLTPEQRGRLLDAQQKKEGWIPGRSPSEQRAGNTAPVDGVGGLDQNQGGAQHRKEPISAELQRQIVAAAKAAGVNAEVFSGGQDPDHQYGSTRHNHGNAADLKLYTLGPDGKRRYLSMNNAAERAVMEKFIRESVANGANGVGSGPGYMGESGIHVGGGSPSAWGAGGSSANAPDWVRRAFAAGMEARGRRPAPAPLPTVPRAGSATTPNLTPGGFDVNAATRPALPAGIGGGSISNSNSTDNRAVHQTINNNTTVTGVERPADHARVVESTLRGVHQMSLENAQSAIA